MTLATQMLTQALGLGSAAVLARLLTPADYGVVAMVTAVTGFLNLFKDMGLSAATVQRHEISRDQVNALAFINAGLGVAVMIVTLGCAPLIAWFYDRPHLTWVTAGLAVCPFIYSLGAQHQALLTRQMRFGSLAAVQVASLAGGFSAAAVVGVARGGYWALVADYVVMALVSTTGVWIVSGFRPTWPRRGTDVRQLLRFGGSVAGFDLAYYFRNNLDKVLVGRVWGAESLGLYQKAFSLLLLPIMNVRVPLNKVAFPAMSALAQEPSRFQRYFTTYCSLLAFASMPLVGFMYACADSVIRVILGNRWLGAVELFRILAVVGFVETAASLRSTLMLSSGQGKRLVRWGIWNASARVAAAIIGLPWGVKGVAIAYCVTNYAVFHPLLAYSCRGTAVRPTDFYRAIARPVLASAVMVVVYITWIAPRLGGGDLLILAAALPACAFLYIGSYVALPGGLASLREYMGYLRILLPKTSTGGVPVERAETL